MVERVIQRGVLRWRWRAISPRRPLNCVAPAQPRCRELCKLEPEDETPCWDGGHHPSNSGRRVMRGKHTEGIATGLPSVSPGGDIRPGRQGVAGLG